MTGGVSEPPERSVARDPEDVPSGTFSCVRSVSARDPESTSGVISCQVMSHDDELSDITVESSSVMAAIGPRMAAIRRKMSETIIVFFMIFLFLFG